jgi:hypothetical protein
MIPEEDRGPAWLRDYGFTDFSQIEADVTAMEQFAKKLSADVSDNYAPHLDQVGNAMMTELPPPPTAFVELSSFLIVHNSAQNATTKNVYNFATGTTRYATAAQDISQKYQGSDAFSHAKVSDVDRVLGSPSPPSTDPSGRGNA